MTKNIKKLITVLNIIIVLYFLFLVNLFFWGALIGLFVGKGEIANSWYFIIEIIFALFLSYGIIKFLKKDNSKYIYGMILLFIFWLENQIYRFFLVTAKKFERADFFNFILLVLPILIIYITKYLDTGYNKKSLK